MPSDIEPVFRLSGAPGNCLTPEAQALFDEKMSRVNTVLAGLGWMVAKKAHGLFSFSAVRANQRSGVSAQSLRYALAEQGITEESEGTPTITFSPGQEVRFSVENPDTAPSADGSISTEYDLGDWTEEP